MKFTWKDCLKLCGVLFGLYLAVHYWPGVIQLFKTVISAAFPLIIGGIIAYLVNLLMSFYEGHYFPNSSSAFVRHSRRPVCMAGAFATLAAIVALVISLVLPQLIACIQLIIQKVPGFITTVLAYADSWEIVPDDLIDQLSAIDWNSKIGEIIQLLTSGLGNVMSVVVSTLTTVFSILVTTLISVIFSIYLLFSKEKLCSQFDRVAHRYLKERWCLKIEYVLDVLNDCFRRYIVGQCIEAVILGLLCTLGMGILQLPYATMIGALVAFTALIPVAGAYIGAIVGAFMILTINPVQALIFLIFLVILQQLEGNLIYPRVVGSSIGLPGIWVLAAVTVGGGIMGISGMLLGVPLAAALYRLVRDDVNHGSAFPAEESPNPDLPTE